MTRILRQALGAAVAVVLTGLVAMPAVAGPAELERLTSYIGSWSGEGVMVGGNAPEPFRCRLTVAKGNQAKINYSGRCTLVKMNLSVAGTISYDDAGRRYVAAMSSNAGFTGTAVGQQKGDAIIFNLAEKETDKAGNVIRIGSRITLEGDGIQVDFEVEFNQSGNLLTAEVPFSR